MKLEKEVIPTYLKKTNKTTWKQIQPFDWVRQRSHVSTIMVHMKMAFAGMLPVPGTGGTRGK